MRHFIIAATFLFTLTTTPMLHGFVKAQDSVRNTQALLTTKVLEARKLETNSGCNQALLVEVLSGERSGEKLQFSTGTELSSDARCFSPGNKLLVSNITLPDGSEQFFVVDYIRSDGLLIISIVFILIALLVAKQWGARSLLGMVFSFAVIFLFLLPRLLSGMNALLAACLASALIIPATFTLSHGFSRKTTVAMLSTIVTLILTGLLAHWSIELLHLTGFGSEEMMFLQFISSESLDPRGLLLAGVLIATLGVLDDITISQASIVHELKSAKKSMPNSELFTRAMRVGNDHIASLINTLVLVYTGASLPLLLLFLDSSQTLTQLLSYELIAEEITRTLVGSTGLILAVTITTALAVFFEKKK